MSVEADGGMTKAARRARLAFLAAAGAILVAALLARLAGASEAFAGSELVTLDGDSLYHLRRMRLIADAFPRVPWVDPMIAWPAGAPIPWAAGFDLMGAGLVLLGRVAGGSAGGDLWVAALCPLLGVGVVAATMELTLLLRAGAPGGRTTALAAGIMAAASPQGLVTSRYGLIDHHVAEALAMLLLARWALAVLSPSRASWPSGGLAFELVGGLLSAGAVAVFTGSPLYVALVVPVLIGAALARPRPSFLGSGGPGLLLGAVLAALASAPAVVAHGRTFAFGFPSFLQPLLLAAAGTAVCVVVLVGQKTSSDGSRSAAVATGLVALVGVIVLVLPNVAWQAMAGVREWLLKADPWLRSIDEFQSLLRYPAGPSAGVNRYLGAAGLAVPLVLPLAWLGAGAAGRGRACAFLWVASALASLTLLQVRFGRVFAPFLAAACALALASLAERLALRTRLVAAVPLAGALSLAWFDPRVWASVGNAHEASPNAMLEVAFDLRQRPPGPAPGVLTPWDLANQVLVLAGRPVVVTGFGPYPDPASYWEGTKAYTLGEEELLPWLAKRRVGWMVAGAANLFGRVRTAEALIPFKDGDLDPIWLRGSPAAPLLIGGSGVPALSVHHFGHLLPVFAASRTVVGLHRPLPVIWTYQVVNGADLAGRAPPGSRVVLEIPMLEHGRHHTWRGWSDANPEGRWRMNVPVPTNMATPTVTTGPGILHVAGQAPRRLLVPEVAVRDGDTIGVPATSARP